MIIFWRVLYPLVALAAAPFWMLKMLRRDGWGSGLLERIGIYWREVPRTHAMSADHQPSAVRLRFSQASMNTVAINTAAPP